MKIKIATGIDIGKERTNNEDAYIICPDLSQQNWSLSETPTYIPLNNYGSVLVVADGMGGEEAGEVASSIAIKSIQNTFSKDHIEKTLANNNIDGFLHECIAFANESINKHIYDDPDTCGMGTTIVICWIINDIAHIAWCGDSRCYVFNPFEGIKQLTKDHSLVQELIDKGEISEEEALTHPENNIITRGLGDFDSPSKAEIIHYSLHSNDTILLCTDGLCGYNTNKEIEKVFGKHYVDIWKCRDELMKLALDAGGFDNICFVLASVINEKHNKPITPTTIQKIIINIKRRLNFD